MYCKECGFQLSDDAKFCPNCGTKVELNGVSNIEDNAVWGSIENEVIEEVTTEQIPSNDIAQKDNNVVLYIKSSEERKKIIRKRKTNINGVYHAYWSYEDDKDSKLSPQWYEDSGGRRISSEYDMCTEEFNYGLTFVWRKYERACCKLINGRIAELTPFIFHGSMLTNGKNSYFNENSEWSEYDIKIWSYVHCNGEWHVLDSNMRLYKQTKSWWPSIVGNLIYALAITFMIWFGLFMLDISGEWWNSLVKSYWLYIVIFAIILIISTLKEGPTYGLKEIRRF